MNEKLKEFIKGEANNLSRAALEFDDKERNVRSRIYELASYRRVLHYRCNRLMELAESSPEFQDMIDSGSLTQIKYFIRDYEKEQENSPIVKLLKWSSMSGESDEPFIHSQIYDILGKDDARTFRALLRKVVELADPKLAGDI